jgi:hypothetical protein
MGIPYTAPPGVRMIKHEHPMTDVAAKVPVYAGGEVAYARAPDGNGTRRAQAPQTRQPK